VGGAQALAYNTQHDICVAYSYSSPEWWILHCSWYLYIWSLNPIMLKLCPIMVA